MIDTILFDFDKTLAYMKPSHEELYISAIKEKNTKLFNFNITSIEIESAWSNWTYGNDIKHLNESKNEKTYHQLRKKIHTIRLKKIGVSKNIESIAERIIELESDTKYYFLYEDVIKSLNYLKSANYQLGIVSNHLWNLDVIVDNLGINKYFKTIISSARVGYRKPSTEIYQIALSQLQSKIESTLFIGDNLKNDYEKPKKIGMDAILIKRNSNIESSSYINSLNELINYTTQ
ncbi:MAG: FMN phosphatase YigB, HAD superfamily [Chloroflexi bacterium]|jgi:HAD superfamily hydrolase (TIGR01549 family)|nr:MAG: FMN phosphatase YigB, HAD superfamily [Chloroflexota bacterium]